MSEERSSVVPESAWGRGSRLLGLPLAAAGRAGLGMGRKLLGAPAAEVDAQLSKAAADQLFAVLGELKGGAMKFGQAMSMMEAMLPEELAAPFRARLATLQDSAPPMPTSRVHAVLRAELGSNWADRFRQFESRPRAAASIGQVHRAQLADGTPVAVKVQYPGADTALASDLRQLQRLAGVVSGLSGGLDVVAITREIAERVNEEVDYTLEAAHQAQVHAALVDHPRFVVPGVHHATRRVLVSDWVEGSKLSTITDASQERRNAVALDYVTFLFAGPSLAGILHADPHPGNYLLAADGKLAIVDFGLVARLPDGLPEPMGRLIRHAVHGDADQMMSGLVAEGFIQAGQADPQVLLDYLNPFVEPASVPQFHFHREWTRAQFTRVHSRMGAGDVTSALNVPPEYALIHRVWLSGIAVLAQLDVRADFASVLRRYLPGFAA